MLNDMDVLIQRLKAEERQKEAVHFHMLLAQMNPHFLLNTLNTVKWSAIRHGNEDITNITLSLGKSAGGKPEYGEGSGASEG